MVYLPQSPNRAPSDAWKAVGERLLAVARLPLSALSLCVGVRLLAMPGDAIGAFASRSIPMPVLAYVVAVTLYLFGALVLVAGYRIGTVASLLGGLALAGAFAFDFG